MTALAVRVVISRRQGGQRAGWSGCEQEPFETAAWVGARLSGMAVVEGHHAAERPPDAPVGCPEQAASVTKWRWLRPMFRPWREVCP